MTGAGRLAVGGGVVNNSALRGRISAMCARGSVELFMPASEYCADNAAMVAVIGEELFRSGEVSDLALNAVAVCS